jgi:hypothetical protein
MNQAIIPGFSRTSGDIYPVFATQAPMRLPPHRDSATRSSLVGYFWSSTAVPCDPILEQATLHMSDCAKYQEARS